MKPILSSKPLSAAMLIAILAPALAAQPRVDRNLTARIDVKAPASFVVAARTLQMTARALNSRGAVLRGRNIQWQTSDASRATIDGAGLLLGLSPGPVDVTATDADSGAAGVLMVYVFPGKVSITPNAPTIQVGETLALKAQALDADGKSIPGVPFQYFSDLTALATISPGGVVTGVAEGRATITAAIDMGPALKRFTAFTTLQIVPAAKFRLKTLISSDVTSPSATTLVPTHVSAAGAYIAGVLSLSNGGQALVLSRFGIQALALTGALLGGHVVTRFESVSVNDQGDVAAVVDTQAEWCEQMLVLFTAASRWTPAVLDDTTRCGYALQTGSMDRNGGLAYVYSGRLYYRKPDGSKQLLLSPGDRPAGIDVVGYISNWGATPFGKVLVEAQNGSGVPVYFTWDGAQLKRLFAAGDTVAGQTSQWARFPAEIAPGEFITRIGGSNWSSISRLTGSGWSTIARNGQNGLGWIQDGFDGGNGYVFFFADRSGQTSLMRSNGATTDVLASYPSWRDLSQVIAVGGDAAVAYGTLGGAVPQVLRFSGTGSAPALAPGLTVTGPVSAALAQASVLKGLNPSLAHIRTYGDMLLEATPGGVSPLLKPGDKLPAGNLTSIGGIAANRMGDFAFTAQHGSKTGLFTYKSGQFQIVADADDLVQGNPVYGFATWSDTLVAMNNAGHTAVFMNTAAANGIYVFTSNAASGRNVMRMFGIAPGGTNSFTSVNQIAIDDSDRVAFLANLSNGKTGLFLWDRGTLSELMETGQTDPKGRAYQGFYALQAAGSKFYLRVGTTSMNEALVTDGSTTQVLAADGYVTSFNVPVSRFYGPEIAANSRGDVVFPVLTPSGAGLLVKRADGTDALVVTGNQRGPEDEWFLNVFGAGISEQGDVIFTALGFIGGHLRLAVYQATPI